jgi:hypothetical protein
MRETLMKNLSTWVIGGLGAEVAMGHTIIAYINVTITSIIARNRGEANMPTSR